MLWYKGWLETRFRTLFGLAILAFFTIVNRNSPAAAAQRVATALPFFWAVLPAWTGLAGAGIRTQPAFQQMKGIHGSMYFTLSLPVKRVRLLAARAALGIVEVSTIIATACLAAWLAIPGLRTNVTPVDLLAYFVTVAACVTAFYFLSVFYATLMDDGTWLPWAGILSVGGIGWLLSKFAAKSAANVFRAMGTSSPLFTHRLPWVTMAVAITAAAIFFLAAIQVVRAREY